MSYFHPKELNTTYKSVDLFYHENEIKKRNVQKNVMGVANSKQGLPKPVKVEGEYIKEAKTFYQININNKKPNLTVDFLQPTSYTAQRIYLYGLLHNNIADFTDNNNSIVGELVIEHTPKTALNQRIFLCYLLESSDSETSHVDDLVSYISNDNNDENFKLDLKKIVNNQLQTIHYEHEFDHIFVFMKTVPICLESGQFIKENLSKKTDLFTISAPAKSIMIDLIPPKDIENDVSEGDTEQGSQETFLGSIFGKKKKVEGNTNMNDVYMECELLDESDEKETSYVASVSNSKDSKKDQQLSFFKMSTNFGLFLLLLLFTRLTIPGIYKLIIIKGILKWAYESEKVTENKGWLTYVRKMDYILLLFLFIYLISFLSTGMKPGLEIFTVFFMILLGVGIFGYSLIQLNKQDPHFLSFLIGDKTIELNYGEIDDVKVSFLETLGLLLDYIKNVWLRPSQFPLILGLTLIILAIGGVTIASIKASEEVKNTLTGYLLTTTLLIFGPLAYTSFKVYG